MRLPRTIALLLLAVALTAGFAPPALKLRRTMELSTIGVAPRARVSATNRSMLRRYAVYGFV